MNEYHVSELQIYFYLNWLRVLACLKLTVATRMDQFQQCELNNFGSNSMLWLMSNFLRHLHVESTTSQK